MLYLEHRRNRIVVMSISTIACALLSVMLIQGINAVGVLMATALVNIFVYYSLPGSYSKAYLDKYVNRYH